MKDTLSELHPSRVVARRMHELQTDLERARMHLRRHSKSPDTLWRWGLDQPSAPQQEEGWFITYLDMMTLLLVVMIVMLAFSGSLSDSAEQREAAPVVAEASMEPGTGEAPGQKAAGMEESGQAAAAEEEAPRMEPTGQVEPVRHVAAIDDSTPAGGSAETLDESDADASATPKDVPAMAYPGTKGDGLLPGGSGLLPGHAGLPDTIAVGEAYPGWLPAGTSPLPPDTTVIAGRPALPFRPRVSTDQYPGWSSADLAASFIGPPRPSPAPVEPAATDEAAHEMALAQDPAEPVAASPASVPSAEPEPPSEGETLAAGLSLGELGNDVEVVVHERSVSFRVNSEILFDSSQADLSRSGLSVLRRIVSVLSETGHEITVEGHTDSVPVRRNVRYPSNWELSSARAGSVVRYLQANGISGTRLKAIGYADTRPIGDNHTPDGRARNRRVELVIEKRG